MGKRVKVELEDADGYVYVLPSLVYAREYLGISRAMMETVCDRNIRVAGYLVRKSYVEETNEKDLPRMSGTERRRLRQEVVAFRENEAVKFPSVPDAARTAGCREVTIRQAMRRNAKAGGWFWEAAEKYYGKTEDWFPGMPIVFCFRKNVRYRGEPPKGPKPKEDITLEQKEWKKAGVKTAREWRDYLWKELWEAEFEQALSENEEEDYGIFG